MQSNPQLWERIRNHAFTADEDEFVVAVARRLRGGQENARRAIEEYRRFLYLAEASVMTARPSQPIYAVWNVHADLPNGEWNSYLSSVAESPHHFKRVSVPGSSQQSIHGYEHTRKSYLREFGETPPAEFWPDIRMTAPSSEEREFRHRLFEALGFLAIFAALVLAGALVLAKQFMLAVVVGIVISIGGIYLMTFFNNPDTRSPRPGLRRIKARPRLIARFRRPRPRRSPHCHI